MCQVGIIRFQQQRQGARLAQPFDAQTRAQCLRGDGVGEKELRRVDAARALRRAADAAGRAARAALARAAARASRAAPRRRRAVRQAGCDVARHPFCPSDHSHSAGVPREMRAEVWPFLLDLHRPLAARQPAPSYGQLLAAYSPFLNDILLDVGEAVSHNAPPFPPPLNATHRQAAPSPTCTASAPPSARARWRCSTCSRPTPAWTPRWATARASASSPPRCSSTCAPRVSQSNTRHCFAGFGADGRGARLPAARAAHARDAAARPLPGEHAHAAGAVIVLRWGRVEPVARTAQDVPAVAPAARPAARRARAPGAPGRARAVRRALAAHALRLHLPAGLRGAHVR